MSSNNGVKDASNSYAFKILLRKYTQIVGLPVPVYETTRGGTCGERIYSSQVTLDDITYKSLPGFFNFKAAEQSAAEVALMELAKCDEVREQLSQLIHEEDISKIIVMEYAQKMNYAIPTYQCQMVQATDNEPGHRARFCCTVEIGGLQYIGGPARTKREAEMKAARTAILAIQSSAPESFFKPGSSQLTLIPCKKRAMKSANKQEETVSEPKAKKSRIFGDKTDHTQIEGCGNSFSPSRTHQEGSKGDGRCDVQPIDGDMTTWKGTLTPHIDCDSQNLKLNVTDSNQSNHKEQPDVGKSPISNGDITVLTKETTGNGEVASMVTLGHTELSCAIAGISQPQETIQTSASQV